MDSLMKTEINRGLAGWPGLRRILAIAPWFALSACGGGGGAGGVTIAGQDLPSISPDPTTALQGFYQASAGASPQAFISLVLPASASSVQWYGWYFKSQRVNEDPYLFSGVLDLGLNGAAQSNAAGIKAFTSGSLATGSANLSNASLTGFHASVAAVALQTSLDFDASAAPSLNYQFGAPALPTDLAGRWSGPWSSAGSIYGASTLTFANSGGLVSNTTGFPCDVSRLSLVPRATGNAFTASLVIPAATNCSWTPQSTQKTLHGIAFIHTLAGSSRRLEVMLLDSDGSGISFRGDASP
jgi:hypothetical protein